MRRTWTRIIVVVALLASTLAVTGAVGGGWDWRRGHTTRVRPMIFVHGFSGSGAQFETQALRFASNGYHPGLVAVHEYDSLFGVETRQQVYERLDQKIAGMLRVARADKVDLLAHSLGTGMMQEYLNSSPARAARVAHYVNLDGSQASAPPGGVPTLAIWGQGSPTRKIVGAANLYFTNQTHTQVVTSPETFEQIYTFFTGEEPQTTDVVPTPGRIHLSGRAVLFPQNTGVDNGRLEIYEVNGATGVRVDDRPEAVYPLRDGSWGPFPASSSRNYEFAIVREGLATHHLYFEPFARSDSLVRLLTSAEGGIGELIESGPGRAALTITRYMEWWGDQGTRNDQLQINGVDIVNAANSPLSKRAIAIFVFDRNLDGVTDVGTPIPSISGLPFLTGVDVFVPAATPPNDTISVAVTSRLGGGHTRLVNVPNWESTDHRISVAVNDYERD
jgi:hypothetical protein